MTAFAVRNLSILAYAMGFSHWHYKLGSDPLAPTKLPGFFDSAADMFSVGDVILISGARGATQVVVLSVTPPVVVGPLT